MKFTPVQRQGQRGRYNARIKQQVWRLILKRAGFKCEACHVPGLAVEWAHLFGRPGSGFCLGSWANSRELTAALCRDCHNTVDRRLDGGDLAHQMRWRAMGLLVQTLTNHGNLVDGAPYEGIRVVIAEAERIGWRFDEQRCELVRSI